MPGPPLARCHCWPRRCPRLRRLLRRRPRQCSPDCSRRSRPRTCSRHPASGRQARRARPSGGTRPGPPPAGSRCRTGRRSGWACSTCRRRAAWRRCRATPLCCWAAGPPSASAQRPAARGRGASRGGGPCRDRGCPFPHLRGPGAPRAPAVPRTRRGRRARRIAEGHTQRRGDRLCGCPDLELEPREHMADEPLRVEPRSCGAHEGRRGPEPGHELPWLQPLVVVRRPRIVEIAQQGAHPSRIGRREDQAQPHGLGAVDRPRRHRPHRRWSGHRLSQPDRRSQGVHGLGAAEREPQQSHGEEGRNQPARQGTEAHRPSTRR